jgi:hypothetical protein
MATINELPKIEGIRDFFKSEIYGEVSTLLTKKGCFGDRDNPLYERSLNILAEANSLIDICLDEHISPEEKDVMIENKAGYLYKELADLKKELIGEEE